MTAESPSPEPGASPQTPSPDPGPASLSDEAARGFAAVQPPPGGSGDTGTPTRPDAPRKGPLSFLSGALTSGLLAWLCLGLSQRVVAYYGAHPPHYSAQIAQSIATALKTLIVGMCFLATFSFAFIGVGLALTFVRSLLPASAAGRPS